MTLINVVNSVTRRSIIDVAGVLDTPLKPVTIKSFKRNGRKIMSCQKQQKSSKTIFRGGNCPGSNFSRGRFSGVQFS